MEEKKKSRPEERRHRRTFRFTDYENAYLVEQSGIAELSLSEYMRRRIFGGRPIIAQADAIAIREMRRLGGLLKHNFETLRQGGASPECLQLQEKTLRLLIRAVERIHMVPHDS